MRGRRRARSRRGRFGRKEKLNFTPVIVILCLSVACGYATAKYVVDPVVNYVPQLMAEKEQESTEPENKKEEQPLKESEKSKIVEDDVDIKETGKIKGYALQFGCYSTESAAEAVMPTLGVENLQIIDQNDMYKIIGEIYKSKEEARKALAALPESAGAFVTTIYD